MRRILSNKNKLKISIRNRFTNNIFQSAKNISLVIISIEIILLGSIVTQEPSRTSMVLMNKIKDRIKERILWQFDTFYPSDYFNYLKELGASIIPINNVLPRADLNLKYKSMLALDCHRKTSNIIRTADTKLICPKKEWQEGDLIINKINYPIKLRAKGDRQIHRQSFKKMSFKVDIKGEKRYLGMEEFSMQMPIIRNYTMEIFASRLLRELNISSPRHRYIRLFINGEYIGIRHLEEAFSRELVESSKRRYGPIFSLEENTSIIFEESRFDLHDSNYWNKSDLELVQKVRAILEESKVNQDVINKYFDLDLWAKYFATLDALNLFHGTYPKSVKFYFNPITGLIEPIFYDGHMYSGRGFDNFNFYQLINKNNNNLVYCGDFCGRNRLFFKRFFGDNKNPNVNFYERYIKELNQISSLSTVENIMTPIWSNLSKERGYLYKNFWKIDRQEKAGIMPHIAPWAVVKERLKSIRNKIYKAKTERPLIGIDNNKNKIMLLNQYSEVPQLLNIYCNNDKSNSILLIKGVKNYYNINSLASCGLSNAYYSLNGESRKSKIKLISSYTINLNINENLSNINLISNNRQDYIFSKRLTRFTENTYLTNKDITFEKSAGICLEPNVNLYIKDSNVIFNGNKLEPNIITRCKTNQINNNKSGSVVIQDSIINGGELHISYLSEPNLEMKTLYGSINFIESRLKLKDLKVFNSNSEDSVNFINSNIDIENITVEDAKSDAIDSDYSTFKIGKIICNRIGNDCLDLSFSKGYVKNLIANAIGDKALSIGESSNISLEDVEVKTSEIGIVSKDSSSLEIKNYKYTGVKLPIAAYIKKAEFSSPSIEVERINPYNKIDWLFSADTNLIIEGVKQNSKISSQSIEDRLYGSEYGIKTKR
ncbi:CotH kinase family protein [Prochlorococcus marinus]|uniref:CotH kinase family protein n=1 Tax=Prochlorococcus marinus TaxID=1219 RepID=UPI0022B45740|nr:CotH kinase family protein [Prochlorococcus marinus]